MSFKIGIIVDSFNLPFWEGLQTASDIGANGIQFYAVSGEFEACKIDKEKRSFILSTLEKKGMEVSAVCGDLEGHGFTKANEVKYKIKKSKEIVDLAVDLKTNIVTTHVGVIDNSFEEEYDVLLNSMWELSKYAYNRNVTFAIETGPEKPEMLKKFIDEINIKGLGVNLDPANFVMVTGVDPVDAVNVLAPYVVHTHAKDGKMFKQTDPRIIYDFFADGGISDLRLDEYFLETPLGEGQVNFETYLSALTKVNYNGYLTIERETGENPIDDIKKAFTFLKEKI